MKQTNKPLESLPLFADDATFAKACKSVRGVMNMFKDAKQAGYHVCERWRWRTGSMNRHGVVVVEDAQGEPVWIESWDVGSTRMPAEHFRLTSRHGMCIIAGLQFVRTRVREKLVSELPA